MEELDGALKVQPTARLAARAKGATYPLCYLHVTPPTHHGKNQASQEGDGGELDGALKVQPTARLAAYKVSERKRKKGLLKSNEKHSA